MITHLYQPDPTIVADHRGERPCRCGMPQPNRVHDVAERDPEQAIVTARMLGEGGE